MGIKLLIHKNEVGTGNEMNGKAMDNWSSLLYYTVVAHLFSSCPCNVVYFCFFHLQDDTTVSYSLYCANAVFLNGVCYTIFATHCVYN